MAMETVSEAINRLHRAGYLDEYGADRKGLKSHGRGQVFAPETFRVDEIVRFEGDSDPGDESAVFALTSEDGTKGTYTVAFGPLMDPLDAEMVRKLGHA
jgi:hypothetical protein